ncbi:unnamed protein product [Phytomonas sp. EM1]|nr:unnamed protein product [Phytomonas sp. EM1]|eukprot:CCW64079.1 unnamed protein product [Phytomonas sp. isolate EM1]
MDPSDTFFLNIGAKTTKLWKSEEQFLSSYVLTTPKLVSRLKCDKTLTTSSLTECLSKFLISLWYVYQMDVAGRVILLFDPDEHPQFGYICLKILGTLGLSRYPCPPVVSTESLPLFVAHLHGTSEATIVVDLGHACTRVMPVCHGIVMFDHISYCAGLCVVPSPEASFGELLNQIYENEMVDFPECLTNLEHLFSTAHYFFALEESIQDVCAWSRRHFVASCMGAVTICGGGSDIPSLRHLLCVIVQRCTPYGRILWS